MEYRRSNIRILNDAFGAIVAGVLITTFAFGRVAPSFNKQEVLAAGQSEPVVVEPLRSDEQLKPVEPIKQITTEVETEVQPVRTPAVAERPSVASVGGTNAAMQFIFAKESSNNPYAKNGGGCLGLGQACPGSKLLTVCPDLGNVQCQIQFFTDYANNRYGGWSGALVFWQAHGWW